MCGAAPASPWRGERPQGGGPHLVGGHLAHRVPRLQRLQLLQAPVQLLQGLQRQLLLSILCCGAARRHGRVRGHEGGPGRSGPTEGCSNPRGAGTGRGCGAAQRPAVLSPVRGMVYRCPHASPRGDTQPGDPAGPHAPPGALLMEGLTSAEPFHHHRLDGAAENPTWIPKGKAFTAPHGRGKAAPPLRDSDLPLPPDPVCPRWDTHRTARPCWQRGGCCSTPACGTHRAEHHAASSSPPPPSPPHSLGAHALLEVQQHRHVGAHGAQAGQDLGGARGAEDGLHAPGPPHSAGDGGTRGRFPSLPRGRTWAKGVTIMSSPCLWGAKRG